MSNLVEALQAVEGGELRIVATLDSLDYEIEFIRDDLEEVYDDKALSEAYVDLMANQLSADDFTKHTELGDLDCQVFLYDESVIFLFPSSRYSGLFVSFDRKRPFPLLEVAETATEVMDRSDHDVADN